MTHERRSLLSLCALAALTLLPSMVLAAEVRLGNEFQVNTYTTEGQVFPSIAVDADGDFVVAWASNAQDGNNYGVFAQRFSSAGVALGSELSVNDFTLSTQTFPAVARAADGDFVIAWMSANQDGNNQGIFARRFASTGATLTSEFQVNIYTLGAQYRPSVARDADGDFVVAWGSSIQDGSGYGVFARRFASGGGSVASEFRVNTYTSNNQNHPSVAMDADGDFVIAWSSDGQDGSLVGVFARRFSSAGTALASEFQVNTYTLSYQFFPSAAADDDGDFVVAWGSAQDGAAFGVFARRFSSAGTALASEFQVNIYTTGTQNSPSVTADAGGDFVIAWVSSSGQDGSTYGIFARRLSDTGAPVATEFQVNTYTSNGQAFPSVAADDDGDFVVAWQSAPQDGSNSGVFAQRFGQPILVADIDGDGSVEPLTDGLLILRFLFGFSGSTLTSGVVDTQNCTHCDDSSIATYLASLGSQLDIDGDGSTEPLTDGLLVLRFLFGFTGSTLTTGAVDTQNCTRCDSTTIVPYLQTLL